MTRMNRLTAWMILGALLAAPIAATATTVSATEPPTLLEEAMQEGVAEEDLPVDEDEEVVSAFAQDEGLPSIEGMKPLYQTKIKMLTATGTAVSIRTAQSSDSPSLGMIPKGKIVTIYAVYPTFVLVEFEGKVGYILRTCIDENCTILDPATTPPYGVVKCQFMATTTTLVPIYQAPNANSEVFDIQVCAGNRVAVLDFVDGFARVIYWRSYGYIDARLLTDVVPVSATDEPMSNDTPIAAFSSFFAYNNGSEATVGRCKNIVRSCELMTRTLQSGESLDFNAQIGPYKRTNGYFPAPVLIDGGSQLGYGGGTCQSSSTLYNAIRQLPGITVLMRRPHGPGGARYLPQHTDAAVGNENINLVFRNDYPFPVRILAESKGEGVLTIQLFKGE